MAIKPETQFRKKVRADLRSLVLCGLPLFFEAIQQRAINGTPDFFLCANGKFVALELKATNGIISPLQDAKLRGIANAGGQAWVVDPTGWPELLEVLKTLLEEQ